MRILNESVFPPNVQFTSLIGKSLCPPLHLPPLHLVNNGGDGIFTVDNQNMGQLPFPPPSHRPLETRYCHTNQPSDVVNILRAIGHRSAIRLFHGVDDLVFNPMKQTELGTGVTPVGHAPVCLGETFLLSLGGH